MTKARTLADFISDGSPLADGTISVSEVSGAAPLASPTFTGTASGTFSGPLTGNVTGDVTGDVAGNITGNVTGNVTGDVSGDVDLSALAATIADTAVDVFVYDTSKDSDGGAWRKRTQGTSWYNETLNTATRGSRTEFPAVAVIVAEDDTVTIYDGDDPDLPMWMVFNASGGNSASMIGRTNEATTCVTMLNGHMAVGRNSFGLHEVIFIDDRGFFREHGNVHAYTKPIVDRNGTNSWGPNLAPVGELVNDQINDVAMTVLPNAPIDSATGLPVPTIAVATAGGVSVIKDDGTVVDIYPTASPVHYKVDFIGEKLMMQGAYLDYSPWVVSIPSSDVTGWPYTAQPTGITLEEYSTTGSNAPSGANLRFLGSTGQQNKPMVASDSTRYLCTASGLSIIAANETSPSKGMVAYTTSDYNTGWMNGDIKLATLSDTDDTDVVGSNLVSGDASTDDTNASTGWSAQGGATPSVNSNATYVYSGSYSIHVFGTGAGAGSGYYKENIGITVGKTYVISGWVNSADGGGVQFYAGPSNVSIAYGQQDGLVSAANTWFPFSLTFTATSDDLYLLFVEQGAGNSPDFYIDGLEVRLAEEDRSVNGNGLQVFGSITKTAVATGADLVGYSGFSGSNYLEQPYNSGMDMFKSATGTFAIYGWVKRNGSTIGADVMFSTGEPGTAGKARSIAMRSDDKFGFYGWTVAYDSTATQVIPDGVWTQFCFIYTNQQQHWYINGQFDSVHAKPLLAYTANAPLKFGDVITTNTTSRPFNGSTALWRISATVPSPEQIKKIYEDEKVLFQENAQATLYGTSDAVTALAYDDSTDLLHVGTSAGRSVFQGLRRVDNTTDAVGAAISASNGLVAED